MQPTLSDRLADMADQPGVRRDTAGAVKQFAPVLLQTLLTSGRL